MGSIIFIDNAGLKYTPSPHKIACGGPQPPRRKKYQARDRPAPQVLQEKNFPPLPDIMDMGINVRGITKLLEKLNPRQTNGPDQFSTRVLNEDATEISPYLHMIFNTSLLTSDLPIDWLTANISPIYRKRSRSVAANYRPVSLTSLISSMQTLRAHHIPSHQDHH